MRTTSFKSMFITTLKDPRQGGLDVIALNLPTQGLWIALMLMAVILSLLVSGLFQISPIPDDELGQLIRMSPAFSAPILFALINWVQSIVTVYVLHFVSRMVGGQGEVRDMLSVMIWLQIMTLALAVICVGVSLLIPAIGALCLLVAFFWGLWAIVAFVDAASDFNSLFRALGVCIAGFLAFSFIMTTVASILAAFGIGAPPNV
ncbi:MAG: YIP1 family protein [Pseudomonadota bacterium]